MSKLLKHEVVSKILEIGLIPVFYNEAFEIAKNIVESCLEGGAKVVEFTNRGDFAFHVFSKLTKWCKQEHPNIILGAGTIIDQGTASIYINCGANFIVGPLFNAEIFKICNRRKVAYIPGCQTLSEISAAEEMGADIVKIFPAKVLTPSFIESILGACPYATLLVSGGVEATREDIFRWIRAGAKALNIGSNLIREQALRAGDFKEIRNGVEQCLLWIKEAREELIS